MGPCVKGGKEEKAESGREREGEIKSIVLAGKKRAKADSKKRELARNGR